MAVVQVGGSELPPKHVYKYTFDSWITSSWTTAFVNIPPGVYEVDFLATFDPRIYNVHIRLKLPGGDTLLWLDSPNSGSNIDEYVLFRQKHKFNVTSRSNTLEYKAPDVNMVYPTIVVTKIGSLPK